MRHDDPLPDVKPPAGPLVSCVMPTANRRAWVPLAIEYFLAQDYPNRDLVVVDDGADAVADLVPDDPRVRYVRIGRGQTLGAKRNACVEAARGDLIMHWDDDDWMARWRISYQVEALLNADAEVCGLRQMLFYDLATGKPWLYDYPADRRDWVAGGSLLYTREFWRRSPFPSVQVGSDTRFVMDRRLDRLAVVPDYRFYVAMIHPRNTSPKRQRGAYWTPWNGDLASVMGADFERYRAIQQASGDAPAPAPLPGKAPPPAPPSCEGEGRATGRFPLSSAEERGAGGGAPGAGATPPTYAVLMVVRNALEM